VRRALGLLTTLAACSAPPGVPIVRARVEPASVVAPSESPPVPTVASTAIDLAAEATFVLPIPARDQAKQAPPSGWCGETAIQEGLLHLGVWAPQAFINGAGKPKHPDLYSQEMPIALAELGVKYTFYAPKKSGFEAFAAWTREALEEGDPVIGGVKILPTEHPEWGLDHFVLVVGHGKKGLLVNTTWGSREWVADGTNGLSFRNAFYGIRLRGVQLPKNAIAARLAVIDEDMTSVKLRISCRGLQQGASYRFERRKGRWDAKPSWSETFTAASDRLEKDLIQAANEPARFQCVAL
jgi:hypothetical protein